MIDDGLALANPDIILTKPKTGIIGTKSKKTGPQGLKPINKRLAATANRRIEAKQTEKTKLM